jgi:hypothetical protein
MWDNTLRTENRRKEFLRFLYFFMTSSTFMTTASIYLGKTLNWPRFSGRVARGDSTPTPSQNPT